MTVINPTTATLQVSQTQQFTQSGLGSPVWTLEGSGTLTQTGLYTAPSTGGQSALVRVHSAAWFSVNSSYFTQNADDTLTKNTATQSFSAEVKSNGQLNSVGDAVEFYSPNVHPQPIAVRNAAETQQLDLRWDVNNIQELHPSGNNSASITEIQAGDLIRFEIITGGFVRLFVNGVVKYTTTNAFGPGLRFMFGGDSANGTIIKVPKFYGAGVTGYSEAQANVTILAVLLTRYGGVELYCEANLMTQSDGSNVTTFTDQSGKGRHLTASTNYPTFETNEFDSKPVIRFHGTSNPLRNTAQFTIRCGWILAKYSGGATFTDYQWLLSDLNVTTILLGKYDTANFLDNQSTQVFEFRSNDRIYPESDAPAPMQVFKLIFFRFWRHLYLDGIQLGQQTNFTSTKWHGDVPFLALYSRDFCESDIRKYSKAVADAYDLILADVYPYQADKGSPKTSIQSVNFYDPPEGARISEVLDDPKRELDLKFSARRQAEVKAMKVFHDSHYASAVECIYRDCDMTPPEDILGYINSPYQASGAVNDWAYAFKFKEK